MPVGFAIFSEERRKSVAWHIVAFVYAIVYAHSELRVSGWKRAESKWLSHLQPPKVPTKPEWFMGKIALLGTNQINSLCQFHCTRSDFPHRIHAPQLNAIVHTQNIYRIRTIRISYIHDSVMWVVFSCTFWMFISIEWHSWLCFIAPLALPSSSI